jgi:hypothetical protein
MRRDLDCEKRIRGEVLLFAASGQMPGSER